MPKILLLEIYCLFDLVRCKRDTGWRSRAMVACASVSHAFSWGYSATAPRFSPSICNLLSFALSLCSMFVLKNKIESIPRNFTFFLDSTFHMVYYIHIPIGWMVVRHQKEMKKERAVYPARFISFIYSLSFARRIQTPAASIGAREEQVSRPALFFCKTRDRFLFYSSSSFGIA